VVTDLIKALKHSTITKRIFSIHQNNREEEKESRKKV
jgi:hypothetical protein